MKKKRNLKPSEVIFPELVDGKIKGKKIITMDCPDCELNDKFRIIEVVLSPGSVEVNQKGYKNACGRYRCACTACGYETVITSKNPNQYGDNTAATKYY